MHTVDAKSFFLFADPVSFLEQQQPASQPPTMCSVSFALLMHTSDLFANLLVHALSGVN